MEHTNRLKDYVVLNSKKLGAVKSEVIHGAFFYVMFGSWAVPVHAKEYEGVKLGVDSFRKYEPASSKKCKELYEGLNETKSVAKSKVMLGVAKGGRRW